MTRPRSERKGEREFGDLWKCKKGQLCSFQERHDDARRKRAEDSQEGHRKQSQGQGKHSSEGVLLLNEGRKEVGEKQATNEEDQLGENTHKKTSERASSAEDHRSPIAG